MLLLPVKRVESIVEYELIDQIKENKIRPNTCCDEHYNKGCNCFCEHDDFNIRDDYNIGVHEISNEKHVGILIIKRRIKDIHTAQTDKTRLYKGNAEPFPECFLIEIII